MNQTNLLYLQDSYLKEITAQLLSIETKGNQTVITLDQTIFYPQGGGQLSDKGQIISPNGKLNITQISYNSGLPLHTGKLEGNLNKGDQVKLQLDWDNRYLNMQRHTAGHLLDEAVKELYPDNYGIEGQHGISKQYFIKFKNQIQPEELKKIQSKLDEIINNNEPITTKMADKQQIETEGIRLPFKLPENKPLRLLQIGNRQPVPDGGTQLKSTGEAWPIQLTEIKDNAIHYQIQQPKTTSKLRLPLSEQHRGNFETSKLTLTNLNSQITQLQSQLKNIEPTEQNRIEYLGKKGRLNNLIQLIPQLPIADRQTAGQLINEFKKATEKHFNKKTNLETLKSRNLETNLDTTYSPYSTPIGFLHPVSQMTREMNGFFRQYGFSVMDGPEIETDEYNFKRTNLPPDHPARDLQDTLYIEEPNILLRTHTSSVETRTLADYQPPLRIVIPGKVYRYETTNASNNVMFFQYQGVAVDKNLTMANLKWLLHEFVKHFYGPDQETRFRCKYYPEVEPTAGLDLACNFCNKKGCTVCKGRGWLEALGCGMIHPNILKMANIDPDQWTGFAWGMGLDRLVMAKYNIPDVRMLTDGSITYPYL